MIDIALAASSVLLIWAGWPFIKNTILLLELIDQLEEKGLKEEIDAYPEG